MLRRNILMTACTLGGRVCHIAVASLRSSWTHPPREIVMKGFVEDIEDLTEENDDYRRVLYTGKHLQLVVMSLEGEEIGEEVHETTDQFFRVEKGKGEVWIDGTRTKIKGDDAILVPAGAKHNVVNTGHKRRSSTPSTARRSIVTVSKLRPRPKHPRSTSTARRRNDPSFRRPVNLSGQIIFAV